MESKFGQLVLSRKEGEIIRIGDDIFIKVLAICGRGKDQRAKLGIEAPKEVPIHRTEVCPVCLKIKTMCVCEPAG